MGDFHILGLAKVVVIVLPLGTGIIGWVSMGQELLFRACLLISRVFLLYGCSVHSLGQ